MLFQKKANPEKQLTSLNKVLHMVLDRFTKPCIILSDIPAEKKIRVA